MSGAGDGIIDCDVHCAPARLTDLFPYLSEYWQTFILDAGMRLDLNGLAYPPQTRVGHEVPTDYEALCGRYLREAEPGLAVLNCLAFLHMARNPGYSAALATAINEWLRHEWLDRDERLRAGLVVSPFDVDAAVSEIDRLAHDSRFVHVVLPVRSDVPYGNPSYRELHRVAAQHGLPIALHAWGPPFLALTSTGATRTYLQDVVSNAQLAQAQLLSLLAGGALARNPGLRILVLECGFAWLLPFLWRLDKDWKGIWREVPWLEEAPSSYVMRQVRMTIAPTYVASDAAKRHALLALMGVETLLYASDFPHDNGGAQLLVEELERSERHAVMRNNAASLYARVAA